LAAGLRATAFFFAGAFFAAGAFFLATAISVPPIES
jgi:hypothetical protein